MPQNTVLVIGAGARTGIAVARYFKAAGWRVAATSRKPSEELKSSVDLALPTDLGDPASLAPVFAQVRAKLGVPALVVYNAFALIPTRLSDPLTIPAADLAATVAVNTLSAYEAARLAVAAWKEEGTKLGMCWTRSGISGVLANVVAGDKAPAFIYTGNMMNTQLYPATHSLGIGKNASAYFLEIAAAAYKGRFRFYYADERNEEGESIMYEIDGDAHAKEFWDLAVNGVAEKGIGGGKQGEWCWQFVKGKGYAKAKEFENRELRAFSIPGLE